MRTKNKPAKRIADAMAANQKPRIYYRKNGHSTQGHFNKKFLPKPQSVLFNLGLNIHKTNQKGYMVLRCPFHKDGNEQTPSLNIHLHDGHYRCHACGAKGGDILAFYMTLTGKSFVCAVKELGAWEKN